MTVVEHECDYPETCPVCLGPKPKPATDTTVEARFPARFPGDCRACGLAIHEGQRIAKLSTGAYVHDHPSCTGETR